LAVLRGAEALLGEAAGGRLSDAGLELVEAGAFTALWEAAPESVRREHGVRARTIAGAVCTAVGAAPGNTMLNRVTALGLQDPPTDADLDEIDAFFRDAGTRYAIGLSPFAPPDLRARLEARGFEAGYAWRKFRRRVDPPPEADTALRVEEIGPERGAAFGSVVARGYELPDFAAEWFAAAAGNPSFRFFLASEGDEPAGAGALFVDDRIGWLGLAATVPEHRRKGAQGAILAARIRLAGEAGLGELATETGERLSDRPSNSYRNLLRTGFEEQYVRPNYVSPS
jgi:GNAT superfamily N-acetyltransferase